MKEFEYPFDADFLLKKKKSLKRTLLAVNQNRIKVKIAVLGGSTTTAIVQILDLFLLNYGIEAEFFESEYNHYYESDNVTAYKHIETGVTLELVRSVFGKPEEVIINFDFTITKFAYYKSTS